MANNQIPKANGGLGNVLTTLAGSGDRVVQMLIAGVIILNTWMTNNNGKGIKEADRRLDYLRESMARQVRVVYDNQTFLFDFVDEVRASQDRVQTKLGIAHPAVTPFPRQQLPDVVPYLNTYPNPYQ